MDKFLIEKPNSQSLICRKATPSIDFEIGALTIDPLSSSYDPRPLIPYLKELGVPYLYEEQAIMEAALKVRCHL